MHPFDTAPPQGITALIPVETVVPRSGGSVGRKLTALVLVFVAIVGALLCTTLLSLRMSASIRSYVTGEGLWTRAQKDAVHALHRYALSRDDRDYDSYRAAVAVTLGDRAARLELEKPEYDYAVVERGFGAGGNDPRDVPNLIFLFRNFREVSYLAQAVAIWREGDRLIDELRSEAGTLQLAVQRGDAARIGQTLDAIDRLNNELAPLELRFSATLADAARWVHGMLTLGGVLLAALLLAAGVWAGWRVLRQIRVGVERLVEGTAAVAAGNLDHRIEASAGDELGALARDFNGMVERQRATMLSLEREQEFLKALVSSLPGRTVACDSAGRITILGRGTGVSDDPPPVPDAAPEQWPEVYQLYRVDGRTLLDYTEVPLYRALQGETVQGVELVKRVNGAPRNLLANGKPILTASGEKLGAVVVTIDVTEQRRTQAELARAEASREAKSEFLAAMSHEIRTPINGLLGLLELHADGELSESQRESVRIMRESARTLLAIIDDILDFSKSEAGQLRIESVPTCLRDVVEGAVESVAAGAIAKGLRLTCFVDPALPARVLSDPVRLRQVLLNLCSNAIKFTRDGGIVVRLDGCIAGDAVRLRASVRDTGIGIAPEAQARLFQPFSQAESSTTRRFGGTGLGLSISKSLIERMGGSIGFDSHPDEGTEFWFELDCPMAAGPVGVAGTELRGVTAHVACADAFERNALGAYLTSVGAKLGDDPATADVQLRDEQHFGITLLHRNGGSLTMMRPIRHAALARKVAILCDRTLPPVAPVEAAAPATSARAGRVLVAEDHPTNALVIRRQMQRLGIDAEIVEDGRAALERLATGGYVLLLTDLHMPIVDGFALTEELRRREAAQGRHMPVIALTADVVPAAVERCRAAGIDDVVRKPLSLAELDRVLSHWMNAATAPAGTPLN